MARGQYALAVILWANAAGFAQTVTPANSSSLGNYQSFVSNLGRPAVSSADARENLISFDCDRVELIWMGQHWQLRAGAVLLKDFGRREREAREAFRIIHELRLNQYGTIGRPAPVMEYWLCDGKAPDSPLSGSRIVSIDLANLKVQSVSGQWALTEGPRMLFKFGRQMEDAQLALAVLQRYGFTRLALLGQAAPAMMIFLGGGLEGLSLHASQPASLHDQVKREKAESIKALPNKNGPGSEAMAATTVPPLRNAPQPNSGPRTAFADGQLAKLPYGRQLGAAPPPPDVTKLADRVAFDWKSVEARKDETGWVLAVGKYVLARFGEKEYQAQLALTLVQRLHLTEQLAVGQPVCFSYFMADGKTPRGAPLGLEARAFQPDGLMVRAVANGYALCDNSDPILFCGPSATEAKKFLEVVHKERFDRVFTLGVSREEGMTLLMRGR